MNSRTVPVDGFAHDLCCLTLSAVIVGDLSGQELQRLPRKTFTCIVLSANVVIDIEELRMFGPRF